MLLIKALAISSVLLIGANIAFRRSVLGVVLVLALSAACALVPLPLLLEIFPAVAWQGVFVAVAVMLSCILRRGQPLFLVLSCAATVAAYGIWARAAYSEINRLRSKFPYMSMEDRLPVRQSATMGVSLSAGAQGRLTDLEDRLGGKDYRVDLRVGSLERLHEDTVQAFVDQAGVFGVGRMPQVAEWSLKFDPRGGQPVAQPGPPIAPPQSPGHLQSPADDYAESSAEFFEFHKESLLDFLYPGDFGFIKDRHHVAGFKEHKFSKQPAPVPGWQLQTLDLVGLVLHDEPVAYESHRLPRMKELRSAPTRALDAFEVAGLEALRKGEDLFVRDTPEARRVLGSVRAVKQCVACHGCRRGELLGAFSYTLTRSGR
jgi:hypothetical protein